MNDDFNLFGKTDGYGVHKIAISEASKYIAYELKYEELLHKFLIEVNDAHDFLDGKYSLDNPEIMKALSSEVIKITNSLITSIERGEIKVALLQRDLYTSIINAENTLIDLEEIYKFGEIYGVCIGNEGFPLNDYAEKEIDLFGSVVNYIIEYKKQIKTGIKPNFTEQIQHLIQSEIDIEKMLIENFGLKNENEKLRQINLLPIEKPLNQMERSSLLIIIASLAKEANIDINKSSKAGDLIASLTQQLGTVVSATTVERHLKKIPQALQNRAK